MTYIMVFHVPHVHVQTIHVYFFLQINCSLETYINHDLDKFRVWAIANKSTLNLNKSVAVIVSPKCNDNMNSYNDVSLNYGKSKILINNRYKY